MIFRQGDVLIMSIDAIDEEVKVAELDQGRVVLAYGEATGHAHAIKDDNATLLRASNDNLYLRVVKSPVALVHEEHNKINIPPGDYRIIHQREYHPEEIRRVAD
ncbi:MAG: hypothetical protein AB7F19_07865 [Candidatus Babeliales bacterium]